MVVAGWSSDDCVERIVNHEVVEGCWCAEEV